MQSLTEAEAFTGRIAVLSDKCPDIYICCLLFICQVMSNSLKHRGLQHPRLFCPSLSPRVCSNACPLSGWCYLIISSSVTPFSSCPQSFSASGSFPMSWLFASGGQSIEASASVLPVNVQVWFPLGLTGLISLQYKGCSRDHFSTTIKKHQFFSPQVVFMLPSSAAPLFLLPSIFPSIRVFSNESALCIRWPKHCSFSFSFSIGSFNEHSELISLRTD